MQRLGRVIVLSLLFALPLVYSRLFENLFSFPKAMAFQTLIYFLLFLTAVATLIHGRPRFTIMFVHIPLFLLLMVALFSTLFAYRPITAFFGGYPYPFGWLYWLALFSFFFLFPTLFTSKDIAALLTVTVLGHTLTALLALLVWNGGLPIFSDLQQLYPGRAYGTLGNPLFLGAASVTVLPLSLFLIIVTRSFWQKSLFMFCASILMASVVASRSLGASFTALFLIVAIPIFFLRHKMLYSLFFLSFFSFVAVTFLFVPQHLSPQKQHSLTARKIIWIRSMQMIHDHPLLGVGLSNFALLYPQYENGALAQVEGKGALAEQAHNLFLDMASELGFLGFYSFLWVLFVLFGQIKAFLFQDKQIFFLFLALVTFLMVHLFVFVTPDLWLLFALIVSYLSLLSKKSTKQRAKVDSYPLLVPLLLAGLGLSGLFLTLPRIAAHLFLRKGMATADISALEEAFHLAPYEPRILQELSLQLAKRGAYLDALSIAEDLYHLDPNAFWTSQHLAKLYLLLGKEKKSSVYFESTLRLYHIAGIPFFPFVDEMIQLSLSTGRKGLALHFWCHPWEKKVRLKLLQRNFPFSKKACDPTKDRRSSET